MEAIVVTYRHDRMAYTAKKNKKLSSRSKFSLLYFHLAWKVCLKVDNKTIGTQLPLWSYQCSCGHMTATHRHHRAEICFINDVDIGSFSKSHSGGKGLYGPPRLSSSRSHSDFLCNEGINVSLAQTMTQRTSGSQGSIVLQLPGQRRNSGKRHVNSGFTNGWARL